MTVSPQHVTTDQQPLTKTRLMITVQQYTRHGTMLNLGSDLQDFDGSGHDTSLLEGERSSTAAWSTYTTCGVSCHACLDIAVEVQDRGDVFGEGESLEGHYLSSTVSSNREGVFFWCDAAKEKHLKIHRLCSCREFICTGTAPPLVLLTPIRIFPTILHPWLNITTPCSQSSWGFTSPFTGRCNDF